ncbi:MAG TPA: hypothetical protein VGN22_00725, partial [Pseudonocardia sp.]
MLPASTNAGRSTCVGWSKIGAAMAAGPDAERRDQAEDRHRPVFIIPVAVASMLAILLHASRPDIAVRSVEAVEHGRGNAGLRFAASSADHPDGL